MEPIVLTCGNQTVQFTNTEINVDGTAWPYNGITRIWHVPERSVYAVQCNGQLMAIPYDAQNAQLLQTLLDRIAQIWNLQVEDYQPVAKADQPVAKADQPVAKAEARTRPNEAQPENIEAPAAKQSSGGSSGNLRFIIEMVIGILLIAAGVVGFVLIK